MKKILLLISFIVIAILIWFFLFASQKNNSDTLFNSQIREKTVSAIQFEEIKIKGFSLEGAIKNFSSILDKQRSHYDSKAEIEFANIPLSYSGKSDRSFVSGENVLSTEELTASQLNPLFNQYLRDYAPEIREGSLSLKASIRIGEETKYSISATFSDLTGFMKEVLVIGLNATLKLSYQDAELSSLPTPITIDAVDTGFLLEKLHGQMQILSRNRFRLKDFRSQILGGKITIKDASYDLSKKINQFDLAFEGIDLREVAKLLGDQVIELTGQISGKLPITLTAQGAFISKGIFSARKPGGIIRYSNGLSRDDATSITGIVQQALSNYHYSSLEATISYQPDGETLISAQLQGRNPDMNNGQAVNVNINVEQNILKLLKSLRARRDIEKLVEKRYQ